MPHQAGIGRDVGEDLVQLGHCRQAVALDRLDAGARAYEAEFRDPLHPHVAVRPPQHGADAGRVVAIHTASMILVK